MSKPIPPANRTVTINASLLSFVAGFVDTVGFVAFFGLFTAHVTGNFVVIGAALIHPHNGLLAKLLALPVFIASVALTTIYVRSRQRPSPATVTLAQIILLAAFAFVGCLASPVVDADAPLAVAAGLFGVTAMGVQNAASRLLFNEPPTTVMTGNVTQFASDVTQLIFENPESERAATVARVLRLASPVVTFAAGAIVGALSFAALSFPALILPIVVLIIFSMRNAGASRVPEN